MKRMSTSIALSQYILTSLIICQCFITSAQLAYSFELRNSPMKIGTEIQRAEDSTESTTNFRSWRGQNVANLGRQHLLLRAAHGILNVIGWGILFPIGAIIARYFRKFPMHWNEWYSCHVMCQTSGYLLGTVGWFIGLLTSKSHKQLLNPRDDKAHLILGIIIFILTTIQMAAICWHPKQEEEEEEEVADCFCCRKGYWEIFHHLLGYVLIGLIIADIFEVIKFQTQATKWRWTYVGILGVLALTSISLEIVKRVRSKILKDTVELNSNIYTSP